MVNCVFVWGNRGLDVAVAIIVSVYTLSSCSIPIEAPGVPAMTLVRACRRSTHDDGQQTVYSSEWGGDFRFFQNPRGGAPIVIVK